jgi:hypothetical protein
VIQQGLGRILECDLKIFPLNTTTNSNCNALYCPQRLRKTTSFYSIQPHDVESGRRCLSVAFPIFRTLECHLHAVEMISKHLRRPPPLTDEAFQSSSRSYTVNLSPVAFFRQYFSFVLTCKTHHGAEHLSVRITTTSGVSQDATDFEEGLAGLATLVALSSTHSSPSTQSIVSQFFSVTFPNPSASATPM